MDKRELLAQHFAFKMLHKRKVLNFQEKKKIDVDNGYINLKYFVCDKVVINEAQLGSYIDLEFIPWKKNNNVVYIVTHEVTRELFVFLQEAYREGFKIFLSSRDNITLSIQRNFSYKILSDTISRLERRKREFSARDLLGAKASAIMQGSFLVFCVLSFWSNLALNIFVFLANLVFFSNTVFRVILFLFSKHRKIFPVKQDDKNLPRYSIVVPMYKEDYSLSSLIDSLSRMKYPKNKLDVVFVVEQFDRRTISYLKKQKNKFYRIICVPRGGPQTKPKACSYVLNYIKGDYLIIYDAEDKPESNQLLKAVYEFRRGAKNLACLQGKLSFYNSSENMLTSFFAIEYFCWFNIFLQGLLNLKMPIPLGGSSNHFRVDILKRVGGWDPYNVTEDADLGYTLFKEGYSVGILDSLTQEEAPFSVRSWLKQRTRWVKGHLQTYIVHLKTHKMLTSSSGKRGAFGFHLFLFFPIVAYVFHVWVLVSLFLACFSFKRCRQKIQIKSVFLYSFYYFLHSIASICALYELFARPHYWAKTEHDFFKRFKYKGRRI